MEITNFTKEVLENKSICIVDFWAPWCGPCKMLSPIFEHISTIKKNIKFYKVNVDNNKNLAKEYGVMSIPTIIVFKNGIEIKRNIGFLNEEELKKFLDEF